MSTTAIDVRQMATESLADARTWLQRADAMVERYPEGHEKHDEALDLRQKWADHVEHWEKRLADMANTADAAQSTDAMAAAIRRVDSLRREWGDMQTRALNEIQSDPRLSDAYKAELVQAWNDENAGQAEQAAREAWQTYQRAADAITADMVTASAENSARYDLAAVGTLIQDYTAQIQAPPVPQGMEDSRTHRLAYIAEVLDRADASGNPNEQRAARIAAGPEVARLMGSGTSDADRMSRDLHRRIADMSTRERGRLPALEDKRRTLDARGRELRGSILALEQRATGASGGIFGVSPWQARILGESMETMGGGVASTREK